MQLSAGDKLGHYEVLSLLGKGGMGEVYRARDTQLKRDVALKVLPAAFASDPERLARFQREAELLASLDHPNIGHIHGIVHADRNWALVLALIEGPTLADRIARGPMAADEAIAYSKQIVEALEYAHEHGVIHRDLKPANIKITPEGVVKVLDFGLAKALEEHAPASPDPENSPTLTFGATQAGVIMGTAAYMSPEQAVGKPVDRRSDIFSLGVLLYEMLTGRRPFPGETMGETLAAVVKDAPDWSQLPGATPAHVRKLLERMLAKDRKQRLQAIGEARIILAAGPIQAPAHKPSRLPWVAAAVALLAVAAIGVWRGGIGARPAPHWSGEWLGGSSVAMQPRISPDGRTLAFQAMVDSLTQVAVMKPESGNWQVLTRDRTRGFVREIAWSPDGAKLYFNRFQDGPRGIYSVPVFGGDERLVLEDAGVADVLPDGSLLAVRLNAGRRLQLHRYWPETGRLQPLKGLADNGEAVWARATPSGRQSVFYGTPLDQPDAPSHVYAMDLDTEKTTRLAPGISTADLLGINPSLAAGADGASVLFSVAAGDATRILSVPIDGSPDMRTLLTLNSQTFGVDAARDGTLFIAHQDRTGEVLRLSPSGGTREIIAVQPTGVRNPLALALPDGRTVFASRRANRPRLMVAGAGKEPAAFVETQLETSQPVAMVSPAQAAFMIGEGADRTIGFVSIADGRLTGRLTGTKGVDITSIAPSSDGGTLYYTAAGSVWTIPMGDGTPRKLRPGDSVTVDPYRKELIVSLAEREINRLVRVPLDGGPERPIPVQAGIRVAPMPLHPNAVGRDGRIALTVTLPASWFWPAGLLDPQTGRVEILRAGYDADMNSVGWTPDGKIVVTAVPLRASLWRWTETARR